MGGNKKDWLELDRPERWRGKPGPPKPYLSDLKMEKRNKKVMELKVNPEYESLLPKLPQSEYEALKKSIKEHNLYYPIDVNPQGIILDGHQRYKICRELGIEPVYRIRKFDNALLEKAFVIEANLDRRQLNDFQKVELSIPLLEIEAKLASMRKKRGTLAPIGAKGKALHIVAKKVGVSIGTYERAKKVIECAPEKLKAKVRKGKVSINYAYSHVKRREKGPPKPLPEGQFDVVLADPPWEYYLPLRGSPEMHYPTMPTEKISALNIPAAKDAVLFLWATSPKLKDALRVMESWGFDYRTSAVWVKDNFGTGYYFREKHELLLVGKKGKMPAPDEENRPISVIEAPRKEHSKKPDMVYELIEKMYPGRKYLELFARGVRKGWVQWGMEVG
jgi:N6-adenosine-specific RNA methylase IME4